MKRNYLILIIGVVFFMSCKKDINEKTISKQEDIETIKAILKILDDNEATIETKLSVWVDNLVHMAPNNDIITDKKALAQYLEEQNSYGYSDMTHQIIEVDSYPDMVLMHGQVTGAFYPKNNNSSIDFKTKNLFVFHRLKDNSLKIWKVIFNMTTE